MPSSRLAVACATLFALLAAPQPALARGPRSGKLTTLNLFSPPWLRGIAGLLTRRAGAAAEQVGYTVQTADDAEVRLGHDTIKKLSECDLKVSCLVANSTPLGQGQLLVGTLERDEVHYVVKLLLLDMGSGLMVARSERSVLIASRQLDAQFDAMLPDLLAGKSSVPTRLALTSPQKHVRISVDDRPVGELPLTLELSPGRHELRASKPSFLPVERFVDLEPGQTTTVELPLTLLPNQYDPDAPLEPTIATAPGAAPTVKEGRGTGGLTVAAFVASGVAVVAAGAGTYFALAEKSIANRAVDSGHDHALGITRAEAVTATRDASFANVSFAVAGAAAASAVALFLTDRYGDPAPAPNPSKPQLGAVILPHGAAASLSVRF
jgi:hypothetical protein